ncbi:MAG: hypothetical protein ACREF7_02350 [Candidatus Saccharimonadales bacterium]
MSQITPIVRESDTRESICRAADDMFERHGVEYRLSRRVKNYALLVEFLAGAAKYAVIHETQRANDSAINEQSKIRGIWKKRSVATKIGDLMSGRSLEKTLPEVSPNPDILEDDLLLHERVLDGVVKIGGKPEFQPTPIKITDRILEGTLIVAGNRFELDPTKRLICVDLSIPRSDTTHFGSKVRYTLYPDNDLIQVKTTHLFEDDRQVDRYPLYPSQAGDYQLNMVYAINGLE